MRCLVSLSLLFAAGLAARDDDVVFKSDVALSRVDAQVVDREGRAITGLQARDFVVRVDGKVLPVKNFASENMPIDILLLLDVSGSMGPHVERIADAARQALHVLAEQDRIAIMVFDTRTRVRLPFTSSHSEVTSELDRLVRSEGFRGGTRITSSMIEAALYVQRQARADARRAIVILTDDETQDSEDEPRVEKALARANAVLSFLQAPYEPQTAGQMPGRRRSGPLGTGGGMGWPGGGWPGSGGGGGPVILGPGGGGGGDRSHTAGTETIAQDSGGDTMGVGQASALEDTLNRLRQRYAMHFYMPEGTQAADQHSVRVDLSAEARARYREAEVRSRRVFISGAGAGESSGPTVVTHQQAPVERVPIEDPDQPTTTTKRRRVAVNEDSGPVVNTVNLDSDSPSQSTTAPVVSPAQAPQNQAPQNQAPQNQAPQSAPAPQHTGWPRTDQTPPKSNYIP